VSVADVTWVFFLLGLCLVSVQLSRFYLGHWFTPLSIYACANLGSLGLYHLRLLDLVKLSLATYGLALASVALFTLGSLMACGWRVRRHDAAWNERPRTKNLAAFFYTVAILANTGWLLAAVILVLRFGVGGLLRNLWLLQTEFQMQFIGYLNVIGILVAPAYILKRFHAPVASRRPLDHVLLLLALVGLVLSGIKSYLTFTAIAAGLVWSVARPRAFRAGHFALILAGLLVFFVFYNKQIDLFVHAEYRGADFFARLPWLHRPYLYAVGSWPALDILFQGDVAPPPRFGHVILEPLWKTISSFGFAPYQPKPLPFANIGPDMFNVYSFVGEILWDIGLWPALVFSWLLGLIATRLYIRARSCRYWGHQLIYALFGYGVFISLFQYGYRFNTLFLLGIAYLFGFVVLRGGVFVARSARD